MNLRRKISESCYHDSTYSEDPSARPTLYPELALENAVPIGNPITYPMLEESVYFQISIKFGFLTSKSVQMLSITSENTNTTSPAHHA